MPERPPRWNHDVQRLGNRVDDLVDRVLGFAVAPRFVLHPGWRPSLDVYRVADGLVAVVELPGVDAADLTVTVAGNRLRLTGTRRPPALGAAEALQLEIESGPFERVLTLPLNCDSDDVRAQFRNGLLTLHIPLRDTTRAIRVPIATRDNG